MTRPKIIKQTKKVGRDAHGHPVTLQRTSVTNDDFSDPVKLAQRRGNGHPGAMGVEQESARGRQRK